jgi:hypothetical protein
MIEYRQGDLFAHLEGYIYENIMLVHLCNDKRVWAQDLSSH